MVDIYSREGAIGTAVQSDGLPAVESACLFCDAEMSAAARLAHPSMR